MLLMETWSRFGVRVHDLALSTRSGVAEPRRGRQKEGKSGAKSLSYKDLNYQHIDALSAHFLRVIIDLTISLNDPGPVL